VDFSSEIGKAKPPTDDQSAGRMRRAYRRPSALLQGLADFVATIGQAAVAKDEKSTLGTVGQRNHLLMPVDLDTRGDISLAAKGRTLSLAVHTFLRGFNAVETLLLHFFF